MESSPTFPLDAHPARLSAPRPRPPRRRTRRNLILMGLVICVALLGVGSALLANTLVGRQGNSLANAHGVATATVTTITIVRKLPTSATPTPVGDCHCTSSEITVPNPTAGVPNIGGQVILVSISQEWLWAYDNRSLVIATPVTTGMPQLPTPQGVFHLMAKESNVEFYSPWPYGSPYYYTPEHINYAMLFQAGGYYLHDAPWRHLFGPGTNVPHTDPDGTYETGSHGCVNMPTPAAAALFGWIGYGVTIVIVN